MKAGSLWLVPSTVAVIAIAAGMPFIWSRDFGAFVVATFIYIPALAIVCIALPVSAFFVKDRKYRIATICAVPAIGLSLASLFFINLHEHDRIAFALWYPLHGKLVAEYSGRDGIIGTWDSWGMAGMDNDAYLVSVPGDGVSDAAAASRWVRSHHLTCPIVAVQRMIRGVYIFTTSNCPLR